MEHITVGGLGEVLGGVGVYAENDMLAQVLEQARKDLGEDTKGLPDEPPKRGALDIKNVEFAFA